MAAFDTPMLVEPIRAFCMSNQMIVSMEYPTTASGWTYRADICGPSLHRWDYRGSLVLCGRHSTCSNAVFPRPKCRTCAHKNWRLSCEEPCDTFYLSIANVHDLADYNVLVTPLAPASAAEIQAYLRCAPKANMLRRSVSLSAMPDHDKLLRLMRSEEKFRCSVRSKSADDLSEMIESGMDDANLIGLLTATDDDFSAMEDAPLAVAISVDEAYDKLLSSFLAQWDQGIFLGPDGALAHATIDTVAHTPVVVQPKFGQLFARVLRMAQSVPSDFQLFLMPQVLQTWLLNFNASKRVVFGFYVARSLTEYRRIYLGEPLIDAAVHRLDMSYDHARERIGLAQMRPILVAVVDEPMLTSESILPLGIWCNN